MGRMFPFRPRPLSQRNRDLPIIALLSFSGKASPLYRDWPSYSQVGRYPVRSYL